MEAPRTGIPAVLFCLLLLALPAAVTAGDLSSHAPLAAVGLPNLLQEKQKLQYSWEDFRKEADAAALNGNYEDAVMYYTIAEEKLIAADPARSGDTEYQLSQMEHLKGNAYGAWPGHDAEETAAYKKSDELKAAAKEKYGMSKDGCLIVTAAFGSPLASEVQLVRNFRDGSIVKSYTGSRFMPGFNAWYYSFSPEVSVFIRDNPVVKPAVRLLITPLLGLVLLSQVCYSLFSFNPELATFAAIVAGSTLFALIYVFPSAMAAMWLAARRGWKGWDVRVLRYVLGAWVLNALLLFASIVFALDIPATILSGIFVIVTIVLVTGSLSLFLLPRIARRGTERTI